MKNETDNINEEKNPEFGEHEEKLILSLAFENPEFFITIMPYLEEAYFEKGISKFVFHIIKHYYDKHQVIITRKMAVDVAKKALTADDPHEDIINLIQDPMDPREMPIVMDSLVEWTRKRAYGKLYSEEAIDAHSNGDHSFVEKIIEDAKKITEFRSNFFFFFKSYDALFIQENEQKLSTGFPRLDEVLNNGGPIRGEVVNVMAPTGVGKCHTLDTKVVIDGLSHVYRLETDNAIHEFIGFNEVNTQRGKIRVYDLLIGDVINNSPIKSIRRDDTRYVEIPFKSIIHDPLRYKIFTPDGFKQIKRFEKIKTGETVVITTINGTLVCDPQHRVLTNNGEKFASDLSSTDRLIGYNNEELEFTLHRGDVHDLYDIEIDNPHLYYTSGIISHNSIFLVNAGVASIINNLNVLHVTCEMTKEKTAQRYLGCFTNEWIEARFKPEVQDRMKKILEQKRETYQQNLVIVEYPPNDISVDAIHMNCDVLRRMYGINIDVIIIDYLELLLPRQNMNGDKDYNAQKRVGTEICRLGKKEKALIFTAMQTNRDGNENLDNKSQDKVIELNKVAESYGKTMPMDYILSINQNKQEYDEGKDKDDAQAITSARCRFYVAKNRNGPKFITVNGRINYQTMKMSEYDG